MQQQNPTEEKVAKIVLLGPSMVGKTSIVGRIMYDVFTDDQKPTVGVSFVTHFVDIDKYTVRLQIWDTAGEERFRSVTPMYYQDCNAALICFAINDHDTFKQVQSWINEILSNMAVTPLLFIIGNKSDVDDNERQVPYEEASHLADENDAFYYEVSALSGYGIHDLFEFIARKAVETNHVRITNPPQIANERPQKKCC
ncbi:Ras-related protein Rab-6.1 [Tritrichomonas foetus]|uniref:Ras-related protein Rab-6.1 n=1 Tax=Tritrichomonas foetus TaxID=1144522 RepID=A0A1J4KEV8_9EUKA|nr:Ras-related protein Rab-6.1 [Tritrichomonas foetus]|eukprot:OHT07917.1 Ras-related protein Rab-6.1 [Tritrichomonas foetus]